MTRLAFNLIFIALFALSACKKMDASKPVPVTPLTPHPTSTFSYASDKVQNLLISSKLFSHL